MKPEKILYVDDEAMALKYFERLVSPLAPVLTALSVEEGKEILRTRGGEIAVLVSDQRMPGARGNELLRYARDNHPAMVRMLTTAYSELGEAIEAINAGEIYRYITKPWDLESLRADLNNALELSGLRAERDGLLREKMLVQQQQLLASRITELAIACAGFVEAADGLTGNRPLYTYLHSVMETGCAPPPIDWHLMDHADLMQAEAQRAIAIGTLAAQLRDGFGPPGSFAESLAALGRALPNHTQLQGDTLLVTDRGVVNGLLQGASPTPVTHEQVAWLAWLYWLGTPVRLRPVSGGYEIRETEHRTTPLPDDWLADCIEQIGREAIAP
jgi:two-component system, probable response regulator PhcQ